VRWARRGGTPTQGEEMTADSSGEGGATNIQEDSQSSNYFATNYNPELAQMEACLDENPDFFMDYLMRKGSRPMIDKWLTAHAKPPVEDTDPSSTRATRSLSTGSKSTSSGGSNTPVRKISAHDFEKGGLTKPIVSCIDGTPTFLSPSSLNSSTELTGQIRKKSRNDLHTLNESELMMELVKDIYSEVDPKGLCHKILQNVGILTGADRCSLFLVKGDPKKEPLYLVSNLFDVSSTSTVEDMSEREIRVDWGIGIVGDVAKTGESCIVNDCYKDSRFNVKIDEQTGYTTKTMMCSPIKDKTGEVLGVSQVINKNGEGYFNEKDEVVFERYLQFCGIGLRNAQLFTMEQLAVQRVQVLLDLCGVIFQEQSTEEMIIHRILLNILTLIRCERAMLLLVQEGSQSFDRVYELERDEMEELPESFQASNRFPKNIGITGQVATGGDTVNITNAYEDNRFDQDVDRDSNFKHSTVLAMPIKHAGSPGRVLGVFQLVNKFDNLPFTSNDEYFVDAFAIFCGMGITNVMNFQAVSQANAKLKVTMDVLSYHRQAPEEIVQELYQCTLPDAKCPEHVPGAKILGLCSLQFDDFGLEDKDTLKASLRMFMDLDLINKFNIDYLTLCRWLCTVKKNYREVNYHNWRHAFNVCQLMFAILTSTTWWNHFGEVEVLAMVIACLCHDLDHRGTNNKFQAKAKNPLAQLYSTSILEQHHFNQCVMILNDNQILGNLSKDKYQEVITVVKDCILATDLDVYLKRRTNTFQLIKSDKVDWSLEEHKSQMQGLLMTACDLGAITKPWEIQKKVAKKIEDEFYFQGDLERTELNDSPNAMMDRQRREEFPSHQVGYVDFICEPLYEHLVHQEHLEYLRHHAGKEETNSIDKNGPIWTSLDPMLEGCRKNRENWSALKVVKEEPRVES